MALKYWLLKTEPGDYALDDLVRDGRAVWDGVKNNQALLFLRAMHKGDMAMVYHTGKEKRIVGIAEVVRESYPDPAGCDEKRVVVDVQAKRPVSQPVTLAAIKADKRFVDFHLVRQPRLSVMPVPSGIWRFLESMGGMR